MPQLHQFWDTIQSQLAHKGFYTTKIRGMRMRLLELQDNNKEAKKFKLKRLSKSWKNSEKMFYYQDLLYVLKIFCSKLINRQYDNLFINYFDIEKTQNLIARKYFWPTIQKDMEAYIKGCNICLAL